MVNLLVKAGATTAVASVDAPKPQPPDSVRGAIQRSLPLASARRCGLHLEIGMHFLPQQ